MCKDFISGNTCEFLVRELKKPGRTSDLKVSLTMSQGQRRGRPRDTAPDSCCVISRRFGKGFRES